MNRHKRKRKPKAAAPQRSKAQKRAALMPATGDAWASYRQYYGATRSGKSVFAKHFIAQMREAGKSVHEFGRAVDINYADIEQRALMHLDPHVRDAMVEMRDYHLDRAAEKFGIDAKDVTPEQRRVAKAENFIDLYSGGWPAITNQLAIDDEESGSISARLKGPGDAE